MNMNTQTNIATTPSAPSVECGFFTRQQAAEYLNISAVTLDRWAKLGYVKPIKIGLVVRYKKVDLDKLGGE